MANKQTFRKNKMRTSLDLIRRKVKLQGTKVEICKRCRKKFSESYSEFSKHLVLSPRFEIIMVRPRKFRHYLCRRRFIGHKIDRVSLDYDF